MLGDLWLTPEAQWACSRYAGDSSSFFSSRRTTFPVALRGNASPDPYHGGPTTYTRL